MKKAVRRLLILFLCLLTLLILLALGAWLFQKNYVILNGQPYKRDTEQLSFMGEPLPDLDVLSELTNLKDLDLRNTGLTLGEHEWLRRKLPDCEIRWQVVFQGAYYLPDATEIKVSSLTEADLIMLDYLPELETIDARECRDYGVLAQLIEARHECRVLCTAEIGGEQWDQDTKALTIENADLAELTERLPVLKKVTEIDFQGELPLMSQLQEFMAAFPDIDCQWAVQIGKTFYPRNQESLDLSLEPIEDIPGLLHSLSYLENLKTLDLRGVSLNQEEKQLFLDTLPGTEVCFDYVIDGVPCPVDTKILDLSGHSLVSIPMIREALPYLPELQKILLCDCGLPNEDLAAFNEELEKIRVVWNVQVGGRNTRTDEVYFAPNKWGIKLDDENIYDLRYCTDMVCVDIGHMKKVTNCEWAAFMPELKFLILADGGVRDLSPLKDLKKLKFLELFLIPGQDLSPLKGCTALEDLNLCYVYADPTPIKEMTWLKRLWWSGCWPARSMLGPALPNTEMNFDSKSSTGDGWREGKLYYEMRDFIGMGYMKG